MAMGIVRIHQKWIYAPPNVCVGIMYKNLKASRIGVPKTFRLCLMGYDNQFVKFEYF